MNGPEDSCSRDASKRMLFFGANLIKQLCMNRICSSLLSLLALSMLLSGCAFSTDKIGLEYNPRGARDKMAGAEGVKVKVTMDDRREVERREGDLVSRKINGFGSEEGKIVSTNDVAELVRGAIEQELTLRGFSKGDGAKVTCELHKFWNHFVTGFWAGDSFAEVDMLVQVKGRDGTVLFSKFLTGDGKEPNIQVANGNNAHLALEQAFYRAVDNLFQDPAFLPSLYKAAGVTPPQAQ